MLQQTQFQTFVTNLIDSNEEIERERYMAVIKRLIKVLTISSLRSELYKIEVNNWEINRENQLIVQVTNMLKAKIKVYEENHIEMYTCVPQEVIEKETFEGLARKLEVCLLWVLDCRDRITQFSRFETVRSQLASLPLSMKIQFHDKLSSDLSLDIGRDESSPLCKMKLILKYEIEIQYDFTQHMRRLDNSRISSTSRLQYLILYLQNDVFSCRVQGRSTN
jgi:hypothetical protein